jgi:hypothetical protein
MSAVTVHDNEKQVARPLRMLVPLIKTDLKHGQEAAREAAQQAGMPHYKAAGEKMIEAKSQLGHGEFEPWIKRNFNITSRQAREWMNLARTTSHIQNGSALPFSSIRETVRETRDNPNYGQPASWRGEIDEKVRRAAEQAQRLHDETLSRQQERDAEKKLALQLIDIGFKALASKLHPDKGGSRDAMSRLNRVRDRLKQHA